MSTVKKTNSILRSISRMLLMAVLLTAACPISAYAAADNPELSTLEAFPAIGESPDTMNVNLGALAAGIHSVEIVSADGTAFAVFAVRAAQPKNPTDPTVPPTGDNSQLFLWIALLLVSSGALAGTALAGKKRKKAE